MKTFEFWFDLGSTASYLAWTQLPALEAAIGAKAVLKPMLLGGVFQATGNQSPVNIPAKGKYIFVDFGRFAKRYGVTLNRNPLFPHQHAAVDARGHRSSDEGRCALHGLLPMPCSRPSGSIR